MAAEIAPPEQLLEVVWESDSVEFDDTTCELLNPARVHVSVDVVLGVEVVKGNNDLVEDVEGLIRRKGLLAEGLPLRDRVRGLHLHEEQVVGHDPVLLDWDEVLVFEGGEGLDHLDGAAPLLLVKRGNVDASHHFVEACLFVVDQKDLSIALAEVEGDYQVGVVLRVGRTPRTTPQTQLLHVVIGV